MGDRKVPVDYSRTQLHRVFNNDTFTDGGRFYGGFWQGIPKEYREKLAINGALTIEIDYSSMHPRMLYALAGAEMPDGLDPYTITACSRGVAKTALNVLFNTSSLMEAQNALAWKYCKGIQDRASTKVPSLTVDNISAILGELKELHVPIAQYLHAGSLSGLYCVNYQQGWMLNT